MIGSDARRWDWRSWAELDVNALYALLRLRSAVFVVEQNCVFLDLDGLDPQCEHLCVWEKDSLAAYLRLVPPGLKTPEPALGRLVVAAPYRGRGLARAMIEAGLERCFMRFPGCAVYGQAQSHLVPFYQSLGFVSQGAPYDEDGIPHVDMLHPGAES